MKLLERLDTDLKTAMKARDELALRVLRMVKSDLRYKQIELGHELSDDEIVTVLGTAAKKRKEAAVEFDRGGRQELGDNERAELAIISQYLPEQFSQEELALLIDTAVAKSGATTIKDIGAVMKVLMPEIKGRADGKVVSGMDVVMKISQVPTGNVGNLTAGVIAQRMGVPIARLIAATNVNRVLPDYIETGT